MTAILRVEAAIHRVEDPLPDALAALVVLFLALAPVFGVGSIIFALAGAVAR